MQEVRSLNSSQRRDLIEVESPQINAYITVSPVGIIRRRVGVQYTHQELGIIFRLNHPSLWKRWLDMEDRQTTSKSKLVPGQQFMNSFLLQKDEASRELALREAYDLPRHLQALLAQSARRRLPLNAVGWPELHNLLLSANSEVSDLAQFSRRTFICALILNYKRYRQILQNNIQKPIGDIHNVHDKRVQQTSECNKKSRNLHLLNLIN
ncbi:hypothetical protein IWW34DRAFT_759277 [Fusarium oxysporum f. sp. albedinis]|nr:hypothetical protein IWW34DRAFT_759277 [Fusarium oxysporum f. sp. albedinis]